MLVLLVATFAAACAMEPAGPLARPIGALGAEQVKKLVDAGSGLFLVDTRTDFEFRKGRIPGAVNIPPHRFDQLASLLPPDKEVRLVFYCKGSA